jgi:cell division protein FtsN
VSYIFKVSRMAGFNRDSNENSEVLPFDGGEDPSESDSSNLPMVIVISLLVLAAFGGVVWVAYNNGVSHGRGDAAVAAQAASTVGEAKAAAPGDGALPPPNRAKAYQLQAGDTDASTPSPTASTKVAEQTPAATKPPAQLIPAAPASPKAVEKPAPAKPVPPPAKPAALPAKTVPTPAKPAPVKTVQIQPKVITPVVKPAPAKAEPAKTGAYVLQIGAYTSESDAKAAWKSFQAKHSGALSGYGSNVQKADLGDKGVWYRLRVVGFSDKETATGVCGKLKAEGGSCFLGK